MFGNQNTAKIVKTPILLTFFIFAKPQCENVTKRPKKNVEKKHQHFFYEQTNLNSLVGETF